MLIFAKIYSLPKYPLTKQNKTKTKKRFKILCNSDNKCYTGIYSYCIIVHFNLAVSLPGFSPLSLMICIGYNKNENSLILSACMKNKTYR